MSETYKSESVPIARWRLDKYDNANFSRGRYWLTELLWLTIGDLLVRSRLPGSRLRILVLRAFGASVGRGVVIKPHVRVKFPWRLTIGDHSWIGEDTWIDNLVDVRIGEHVILSQGCYLCTGSHDWRKETFDLIVKPITIGDGAWVCAMARIALGVTVGNSSIVGFGTVLTKDLAPRTFARLCAAEEVTFQSDASPLPETKQSQCS